jgi:RNA polymerase sigma-70 factor, ECF subfamily
MPMVGIQHTLTVGEMDGPAAESALLRDGRAGDRAALEALLGRHKRALFGLCYGILGDADDAEDAVQETFLLALRALPGFRGDAAFRTWIFRIGVHLCLRWKSSHRVTEPWDEECSADLSGTASPEEVALRHLRLREALQRLLPRHRVILLLKEREGWTVPEIAAVLGWKPKRVENELSRARRVLAEWRRRDDEEGDER